MFFKEKSIMRSLTSILEGEVTGGHDLAHAIRVRDYCRQIGKKEGGDREIIEAAALLHDIGRPEEAKNPGSDHAKISADMAKWILLDVGFPREKVGSVAYAIRNHRHSSGVVPDTLEAKILQDGDRLDFTGAMAIVRTFVYAGAHNKLLYNPIDPMCEFTNPNGKKYAIDHILTKALHIAETMNTNTGREIAHQRKNFLLKFIHQFKLETAPESYI